MRLHSVALAALAACTTLAMPISTGFTPTEVQEIELKVPQLAPKIQAQAGTSTSGNGPDLNYSDLALIAKQAPEYAVKAESLMIKWWNELTKGGAASSTAAPDLPAPTVAPPYVGQPSSTSSANLGLWTAAPSGTGSANNGLWTPSVAAPTPTATSSLTLSTLVTSSATPSATPSAAPVPPSDPAPAPAPAPVGGSAGTKNVVYWGQSTAKTLDAYCAADSGMDTIVLAFTYTWGQGQIPSGGVTGCGWGSNTGSGSGACDSIAKAITQCQSNGKQVLMSLGGANGNYGLSSAADAQDVAKKMFAMFGGKGATGATKRQAVERPFGDAHVDGFDLDVEGTNAKTYLPDLVSAFRDEYKTDPANKYIITGAPQCPVPEPNMGDAVSKAQFDELYIQFYNNPECATSSSGKINFADWETYTAKGPSKDAKLFIGMPSSPAAANAASFFSIDTIKTMVDQYKSSPRFGGTMLWDAGYSDANAAGGKTFAQQVKALI